eukprot:1193758-Prorocentrum_minimum.AAC.4
MTLANPPAGTGSSGGDPGGRPGGGGPGARARRPPRRPIPNTEGRPPRRCGQHPNSESYQIHR